MHDAPPAPASGVYGVLVAVACAVVAFDQATKALIVSTLEIHEVVPVIDGLVNLVHVRNPGAAFSLLADAPPRFRGPFFVAITAVAIVALLIFAGRLSGDERSLRIALGAVVGGAVGNLVDRLIYGEVVDFVDVYWGRYHWPAFNVADSSITLAVVAVILHSFGVWGSPQRHPSADRVDEALGPP